MDLSKFCPECGKEVDELFGREKQVCSDCYTKRNNIVDISGEISIEICSRCGKMRKYGEWHEKYSDREKIDFFLSDYENTSVEIIYELEEKDNRQILNLEVNKGDLSNSQSVGLNFEQLICLDCEGFEGDYAKTKIQLRGEKIEELSMLIDKRSSTLEEKNNEDFMLGKEKVEGGVDYYLSTEHMSQQILDTVQKEFDMDIKRSYQKIGHENGEGIYQNTVLVKVE